MTQRIFILLMISVFSTMPILGDNNETEEDPIYLYMNSADGLSLKVTRQGITPESAEILKATSFYGSDKQIHSKYDSFHRPIIAIADSAFHNCVNLQSMQLPCTLTNLGAFAFDGCASLSSISIDTLVTTIGEKAFKNCAALTKIYSYNEIPPNCEEDIFLGVPLEKCTLYVPFGTSAAYREADGWSQITNIVERQRFMVDDITYRTTSNETVETIWGEWVRDKYYNLMYPSEGHHSNDIHFTLPASVSYNETEYAVTAIAPWSFHGLTANTITIPGNVKTIGSFAFYNLIADNVAIKEGVEHIAEWAFSDGFGESTIKKIALPNSLETIGDYAFTYCRKLNSLDLGNGIKYIGKGNFQHAVLLTTLTIPASVDEIGENAFENWQKLQSVRLGEGLSTIKEGMFRNYPVLTNALYLPKSLITIESRAFAEYPYHNFWQSITLYENVESIGHEVFSGCDGIKDIYVYALQPPICEDETFNGISPKDITLHVPEEALELYKNAVGWSNFFETISTGESVADKFTVSLQRGVIIVEGVKEGETLSLYSSSGVLLYNLTITDSRAELPLPSPPDGIYIVSDGKKSVKIAL